MGPPHGQARPTVGRNSHAGPRRMNRNMYLFLMSERKSFRMDHNGEMVLTPGLPGMLSICGAAGTPI